MTTGPAHPPQQQPPVVNAPELEGGEWVQDGPVPVRGRGQPLLVDF